VQDRTDRQTVVTMEDTDDTQRLTASSVDSDDIQQPSTTPGPAEDVEKLRPRGNSYCSDTTTTTTTTCRPQRRFTTCVVVLFVLLVMLFVGAFCVWTTMLRLSRIEARLERLEVLGGVRRTVDVMVEPPPPHDSDHLFTRSRSVYFCCLFLTVVSGMESSY